MLTVVGIMRGKAASSGHPLAPPALQAALLLAVLLLHLGLMASPLHQQMLGDEAMAAGLSSMSPGVPAVQVDRADHGEHVGHCLIRWVNVAQRIGLAGLLAVVLAVAMLGPSRLIASRRPIARALGPPATGDPQALLQVFRL